ncbi:MAG: hypothetical protein J6M16_00690 [Clostridia bacterium]|nr:hypothetical protein [Clostridia bacterium]
MAKMKEIIEPPVYWHSSVEQVNEDISKVKKGKVHTLLPSAGKRPIYMVEYGEKTIPPSKASLSSALGAQDYRCYADKTGDNYVPTVFLAGCMHGGEFEGTVALMNLISLLETGEDLAGKRNDEVLELANKLHILILPMCNPDGRSHVPFDNFVGHTFHDLRYYGQGTWKDGTLCGWPGCKTIHPIKDYCEFLGGYFNDDGVNMMHDDYLVDPSNEVRNVIKTARDYAPDFTILFHGGGNTLNTYFHVSYINQDARNEIYEVGQLAKEAMAKENLIFEFLDKRFRESGGEDVGLPPFMLTSAVFNVCGEPCVTFESNQGLTECDDPYCLTNDEIYRSHFIYMEVLFDWVLKNKNAEKQREKLKKLSY